MLLITINKNNLIFFVFYLLSLSIYIIVLVGCNSLLKYMVIIIIIYFSGGLIILFSYLILFFKKTRIKSFDFLFYTIILLTLILIRGILDIDLSREFKFKNLYRFKRINLLLMVVILFFICYFLTILNTNKSKSLK